ncbi:MAG: gamma-glutamyl-gamma-aminobutyrate hydrolase family protein [Oscillospiraceae bacterium]|nr:gamma-glutamyl-gamma-aminobutyrate hydrolase family protein [Oscillospiraceae bacterium]
MSRKPVIGITPLYNLEHNFPWMQVDYLDAVAAAGGLPVVLPSRTGGDAGALLDLADGVLFTGGPDIMPHLYGEQLIPQCGKCSPLRDEMEIPLAYEAASRRIPIVGICRGIQTINAALGGTLYQDIPTQHKSDTPVLHSQENHIEKAWPSHKVTVQKGSLLHKAAGEDTLTVNSMHHQAVKNIAPGFKATAWSEDGIIECMEYSGDSFILGIQWHPECMHRRDEASMEIFRVFIAAASAFGRI